MYLYMIRILYIILSSDYITIILHSYQHSNIRDFLNYINSYHFAHYAHQEDADGDNWRTFHMQHLNHNHSRWHQGKAVEPIKAEGILTAKTESII